ncbi:ABC transporter permease [bacterium]|nr:ABC transporter permease [bacterium]
MIESYIAKRYLFSKHKIGYISFVGYLSMVGIAIGVAALILTFAILDGFEGEISRKIMQFENHIQLRKFHSEPIEDYQFLLDSLAQNDEISSLSPHLIGESMIRVKNETDGVIVYGITADNLNQLNQFLKHGDLSFTHKNDAKKGIILSEKIAKRLDAKLNEKITLYAFDRSSENRIPYLKQYFLTGIYQTGMAQFDETIVFISLDAAQKLFRKPNTISGVGIRIKNLEKVEEMAIKISDKFGYPFRAESWRGQYHYLLEWLQTQKMPVVAVFGLITIVALFNLISSLVMIVLEKRRDISVLKSMGASRKNILRIFLLEGFFVGGIGFFGGLILALILGGIQEIWQPFSLSSDVYFIDALPIEFSLFWIGLIGIFAVFASILAAVFPAMKASQIAPAKVLRSE